MLQYVKNGGSIFFIADHYNADRNKNRWDSSEVFNGYRRGAWDNPAKGMSNEEANSQAMQGVESSDWLSDNLVFASAIMQSVMFPLKILYHLNNHSELQKGFHL